ncbi:MAG: TonB-dependent receptor domain-containing protein, partial [Shewanella sp.]
LQLLPNLWLQQQLSLSPIPGSTSGGQGSFGSLDYQTLTINQGQGAGGFMFEGAPEGDAQAGMYWGAKQQQYGMVLAADHRRNLTDEYLTYGAPADSQSTDLLFKVNAQSLFGARNPQFTEFTYQFYDDDSYRSPLGLSASDWFSGQALGYSAAATDKHQGRRHKYQLSHQLLQADRRVITDFYYQSYEQQLSQLSQFNGQPIDNEVLAAIARFDKAPSAAGSELSALSQDNEYSAFGVQTQSINQYGPHQVTYLLRYHTDKAQMRLAQSALYWQEDRRIIAGGSTEPLAYRDDATAFTSAIDSRLRWQALEFKLGLTYEDVDVQRKPALTDPTNLAADLAAADFSDSDWLPQLGVEYQMQDWRLSADIRRAWSAASAANAKQEAQASLHYQLKLQYERDALSGQLTAYQQDFDNLHVDCARYGHCRDGQVLTQENIADVQTFGVELALGYTPTWGALQFPISVNYQYLNAQH